MMAKPPVCACRCRAVSCWPYLEGIWCAALTGHLRLVCVAPEAGEKIVALVWKNGGKREKASSWRGKTGGNGGEGGGNGEIAYLIPCLLVVACYLMPPSHLCRRRAGCCL